MTILGLTAGVQAQLTISDDFDDGNDLGWTAYEGGPGTREVRFHGGQYQIINHGSFDESGIFTRGASIRNDATYSGEFFVATDVVGWAPKETIGFAGPFILARVTTPGSLTTFGYLTTILPGGPLSPQSLMGFVEFQSELQATGPDQYTGGTVLTAALDPAKGYRYVFHSGLPADLGGLLIAELYDLTDLLEPVARGVARDDLNNASHTSGVSGIGNFQVGEQDTADWTGTADTTFDNFYASPDSNNFVGFITVLHDSGDQPNHVHRLDFRHESDRHQRAETVSERRGCLLRVVLSRGNHPGHRFAEDQFHRALERQPLEQHDLQWQDHRGEPRRQRHHQHVGL
ncbi:MAG: hypothetical protein DME25_15240 [Verrucomicrobia bacterium]|nr:MAG: hypothetical protein DME25_15240 [Verrucomicrobiota bacterium]